MTIIKIILQYLYNIPVIQDDVITSHVSFLYQLLATFLLFAFEYSTLSFFLYI